MIIKINYNKSTNELTITDDESTMDATITQVVDTDEELQFEIPLNVSAYQTQFEEIELDGNDN
tara:strand:+ start:379 stop:567 length:189 start_codon:yes stop_codon:yes gene_type:complete